MAIWTESAIVSTHGTLDTLAAEEAYFESANVNAIASLLLTGTPRIYIETAIASAVASVSAVETGSGLGDVTNLASTVDATGLAGTISQGAVESPLPVITGGPFKAGDVIVPLPIVAGTSPEALSSIGNLISTPPIVTGELKSGQILVGDVQAPLSQVNAISGSGAFVQVPFPIVDATGLTGRVGVGAGIALAAQVTGVLVQTVLYGGDILLPSPVVSGDVASGALNVGSIENRLSVVNAIGLNGGVSTSAIIAPVLNAESILLSEVFSIGEILVSLPLASGIALNDIIDFITWALNTESNRTTNYTQFPFIALGHMGDNPVGAAVDGIYLLTGDNDDGQPIDSTFKFGMTDFRSQLANASDVYIGGDIEGDMEIGILEDGQDVENIYTLFERERHVRGHHAKLGKGFRSRYRQLSISNVNGGNFELDSLSLSPRDLKGIE